MKASLACIPLMLTAILMSACAPSGPSPEDIKQFLSQPYMRFKSYNFDPKTPLENRIGPCPGFLVEFMKSMDNKTDYQPYTPTPQETELIRGYLATLPAPMRQAYQERLVGIYFVKNFTGNGMSDWLMDEAGQVYAWLVLNPAAFQKTISETLTARETSVFKGDAGVAVDCGTKYKGVLYTILHEGLHVYDYARGVTPYVEDMVVHAARGGKGLGVSWDVWESIKKPRPDADYPGRDKLRFYGLGGGPAIPAADAARLYKGLMRSPFPSLYGSRSWAEDAAELFTFYHLTRILKQPYVIRVAGKEPMTFEPMKSGKALGRAESIYASLYGSAGAVK
jgi:hypothetical protein